VVEILEENFASHKKYEEFYILQIKHCQKLMPHLVMPNFQPMTMAFSTTSTFATRANKAQKVSKKMKINSHRVATKIGIGIKEKLGS